MPRIERRLLELEKEIEKIRREICDLRKEISGMRIHPKEKFSDDEGNVIWW